MRKNWFFLSVAVVFIWSSSLVAAADSGGADSGEADSGGTDSGGVDSDSASDSDGADSGGADSDSASDSGGADSDSGGAASLPFTPYGNLRYRLETVAQDGLPRQATASTVRVKAGLVTDAWQGFSLTLEGEAVTHIGAEKFNNTVNSRTQFPVVADPDNFVLNQAFVQWRGGDKVEARAGRQVVNLDNQRWIGSVGWRQNDQTLDAVLAQLKPNKRVSASYGYSWRVNRIFGSDSPRGTFRNTDIHLLRSSYAIPSVGTLSAYAYLLDIPSAAAASSKTFGVRFAGERSIGNTGNVKLLYTAEYAQQSEHGSNRADFRHAYLLLEPGLAFGPVTAKIGYERLEGDGTTALQTPLATLHAFNGWADQFLGTPARGLRDVYADITFKPSKPNWLKATLFRIVYHDYKSTQGSLNYGQEWNLLVKRSIGKHFSIAVKYADYDSNSFATDTQKFWLTTEMKF